jgi:hypothetical protein
MTSLVISPWYCYAAAIATDLLPTDDYAICKYPRRRRDLSCLGAMSNCQVTASASDLLLLISFERD